MSAVDLRAKPFNLGEAQCQWVKETLASMSLHEKAGQLFCLLGDAYAPETLASYVRDYSVGGVLFRPSPAKDIRGRYERLDEAARIPLLKAANLEEGGAGGMSDGTFFANQLGVAATNDLDMAERFALACASEGRSIGVNWTFSPVVDIDMNCQNPITNVRTFGSDFQKVFDFSRKMVSTLQGNGVAACAKHFPGDGVDFRDQHLHPTYNSLSVKTWRNTFGMVYKRLIDDGLLSIMAGHIAQPALSMEVNPSLAFADCLPASLSKELLTDVLRGELGFGGLICTDATIMGGFTMAMPRRRAIPSSIAAGCDMLVFTTDFEEDHQYIIDGIRNGILTEARLDEAITRVLALKCAIQALPSSEAEIDYTWADACADKAITLEKDLDNILPTTPEKYPLIRLVLLGSDACHDGSIMEIASALLEPEGFSVERYNPFADDLHGTGDLPDNRLTLILANCPTASNNTVVRIGWCEKHAMEIPRFVHEEPTVFVSLSNPYHLMDVPRVRTYINTFSATKATITSVIQKIIGKSAFTGVSPVDAFCGLPDARL